MPRRTPGSDNRVLLVCRLLNRRRARYLITGGVAANLHGSVRATKDIDLLIPKDAANARRLLDALSAACRVRPPCRRLRLWMMELERTGHPA